MVFRYFWSLALVLGSPVMTKSCMFYIGCIKQIFQFFIFIVSLIVIVLIVIDAKVKVSDME